MQALGAGGHELLEIAGGLADAVLVLDQRDAHIVVAEFTKADAGGNGDIRFLDQDFRELEAAERRRRAQGF